VSTMCAGAPSQARHRLRCGQVHSTQPRGLTSCAPPAPPPLVRPPPPPSQHLPTLQGFHMNPVRAADKEWAHMKTQSLLTQILHHVAPLPSDVVVIGTRRGGGATGGPGGGGGRSWRGAGEGEGGVCAPSSSTPCHVHVQATEATAHVNHVPILFLSGGNFAGKPAWKGSKYGTPALKVRTWSPPWNPAASDARQGAISPVPHAPTARRAPAAQPLPPSASPATTTPPPLPPPPTHHTMGHTHTGTPRATNVAVSFWSGRGQEPCAPPPFPPPPPPSPSPTGPVHSGVSGASSNRRVC
jgi:hypothetical protein